MGSTFDTIAIVIGCFIGVGIVSCVLVKRCLPWYMRNRFRHDDDEPVMVTVNPPVPIDDPEAQYPSQGQYHHHHPPNFTPNFTHGAGGQMNDTPSMVIYTTDPGQDHSNSRQPKPPYPGPAYHPTIRVYTTDHEQYSGIGSSRTPSFPTHGTSSHPLQRVRISVQAPPSARRNGVTGAEFEMDVPREQLAELSGLSNVAGYPDAGNHLRELQGSTTLERGDRGLVLSYAESPASNDHPTNARSTEPPIRQPVPHRVDTPPPPYS